MSTRHITRNARDMDFVLCDTESKARFAIYLTFISNQICLLVLWMKPKTTEGGCETCRVLSTSSSTTTTSMGCSIDSD